MIRKLVLALLMALCASNAGAAGWPVIDVTNLVENIEQVTQSIKQYEQMIKDYEQMLKDYEQHLKDYKTVIGSRGMSLIHNGTFEKNFLRRYMPADFDLAMNMRYGTMGTPNNIQFENYLKKVVDRYKLPEVAPAFQYAVGSTETMKNVYDDRLRASQASMAATQTAQLNIDSRLGTIEGILNEAENGGAEDEANDLKRSVDLNTRMVAETAFLQAELIRLTSQQLNLQGLDDQEDLVRQSRRQAILRYEGGK